MKGTFYNKIDELCRKFKLTHRDLAEEIGVSEVTMSRYLNMDRTIALHPFMSMCSVLNISPEELYETYLYAELESRVARYRARMDGEGE